jgi:hypothetical protein
MYAAASLGDPMGLPDKATVEVEGAASEMADDPESRPGLAHRLKSGRLATTRELLVYFPSRIFGSRKSTYATRKPRTDSEAWCEILA